MKNIIYSYEHSRLIITSYMSNFIIIFQKARTNLYRKLENINNTSYEESSISLLSNLNISNDNILNIDNVLLNISCGVDTFW